MLIFDRDHLPQALFLIPSFNDSSADFTCSIRFQFSRNMSKLPNLPQDWLRSSTSRVLPYLLLFPQPCFLPTLNSIILSDHDFSLSNSQPVSSDADIAIAFGLIGAILSLVGVLVACLTLRFMMVEKCRLVLLLSFPLLSYSFKTIVDAHEIP